LFYRLICASTAAIGGGFTRTRGIDRAADGVRRHQQQRRAA
jgi:hypothetical protein